MIYDNIKAVAVAIFSFCYSYSFLATPLGERYHCVCIINNMGAAERCELRLPFLAYGYDTTRIHLPQVDFFSLNTRIRYMEMETTMAISTMQ